MSEDSVYQVMAERVIREDTVVYQVSKQDLKALYEQAFGEVLTPEAAVEHWTLALTYVPLILLFLTIVTLVNKKWNRVYKRIKEAQEKQNDLSDKSKSNMAIIDKKQMKIPDRLFHFSIVWICAAAFDSVLILTDILPIPISAVFASFYSINRIFKRLSEITSVTGISDDDLSERFEKYTTNVLLDPIKEYIRRLILKETK